MITSTAPTAERAGCVRLVDIQRPLSLFAQGLAGRYLHLNTEESKPLDQSIDSSDAIALPARIDDFDSALHNSGAYRIDVLRQIGYLLDGTLDFNLMQARQQLAMPWAPLRPTNDSELEAFFACWSRPRLLRRVFLVLEAMRIDELIRYRYPGARKDLQRRLALALSHRPAIETDDAKLRAIELLTRYSLGAQRATLLLHDTAPQLEQLLDLADAVRRPHADVYQSARSALAICALLDPTFRDRPVNRKVQGTSVPQFPAATEYLPDSELAGLAIDYRGELIGELARARRPGGQIANLSSDVRSPISSGVTDPAQSKQLQHSASTSALTLSRAALQHGSRSYLYDEWDYHQQDYLKGWCRLFEQRLQGSEFGFIDDVHQRHSLLAQQVRRQFGFIRPESWHRVRRTNDGDELELDGVIEAVIDRRTTGASDSQLYIRRDRALRDVAAAFLMDMSASTGYPLPDPASPIPTAPAPGEYSPYLYGGPDHMPQRAPRPKRRVIDAAKDALALMCEALQRLGDSCAIYGFSGDGHEHVEFHIAKDFRDRLSGQTWSALAAMQPLRSTRMGPAIRHAVAKLMREPARMKILIIVSDGYPQDHDYGPDRRDDNYGIEDTACALREAERAGVTAFCVTIDPAGHDYLRRMCAESRYMVIDDVMALPRELTKIYRTLTAR